MKKLLIILYLLCSIAIQAKEINENKNYKKGAKTNGNRKEKHLNTQQLKWGVWDAIVDFADWLTSPFRPVWGDYVEDGMRAGNPWPKTMFPRSVNDDVPAMVNTIKDKVINENPKSFENNLYYNIYTNAQKALPALSGSGFIANESSVSSNFTIGKNAAFVYMIGKRPRLVEGSIVYTTYDLTPTEREVFLNKALSALTRKNGFSSLVDGVGLNQISDQVPVPFNGNWSKIQYRSKELIMMCQAYDILETCKNRLGLIPNQNFDGIRSNIKGFAISMYRDLNALFGMRIAKNNYTLMPCGALGLAAIMLNTEKTFLWANTKKPKNWINSAMYNMHETMWSCDDPMSKAGDLYGFAEGPGYFKYTFENLLPFFKAFDNFVSYKGLSQTYRLPFGSLPIELSPYSHRVKHPFYDEDYKNLYKWYKNIQQPDGTMPSYDDTYAGLYFGALAISGSNEFSLFGSEKDILNEINPFIGSSNLDLTADYLTSMNFYKENANIETEEVKLINMPKSGNFILKSNILDNEGKMDRHYLHLLSEKNVPNYPLFKDLIVKDYHTHEHPDAGSFTIMSDDDQLLIDPAYFYDNQGEVNQINTYMAHNGLPFSPTSYDFYTEANNQLNSISFICKSGSDLVSKRNITPFLTPDQKQKIYYELTDDFLNPDATSSTFAIRFNGNGNSGEGTFSVTNIDNVIRAKWDHPCSGRKPSGEWGLLLESTNITNGNNTILHYLTEGQVHGNISGVSAITNLVSTIGYGGGYHTRLNIHVPLTSGKTNYMTIMTPYKCADPPQFSESVSGNRLRGLLKKVISINDDTTFNLHVVHDRNQNDSIINPFTCNSIASLKTNAHKIFFSYSLNQNPRFGCCVAKSNFRAASIENGDTLIYNDTLFIKSNRSILEANYRLVGKYKYQGYVKSQGNAAVSFFLPDLDTNYRMKASADTLMYYYDVNTHEMTLFVKEGITYFIFELDDQCALNCYFPPTIDSVRTTFNFNNGLVEALPHKLTITTPNGLLKIENGSTMSICPGNWLRNTDSLIMENRCINENSKPGIVKCYDILNPERAPTIKAIGQGGGGRPSTIIVNEQAALILDTGSYTRVGNNCTIMIEPYGTLIIRENAKLDIGDDKSCGYALIVCRENSYVHIENNADLKFWKIDNDTNDKQYFYIVLNPSWEAAKSDIEPSIKTMLLNIDTNIVFGTPVPICNLSTIKAPHGINNRDWGWANFAKPKAWARLPKLTFCPGECPEIDFGGMLNNVGTQISFYRIDTSYVGTPHDSLVPVPNPYYNVGGATSNCDTFTNSPFLRICHSSLIAKNKWYKVKIRIANECYEEDSIDLHYFMLKDVDASFTINKTMCIDSVVAIENTDTFTRLNRENTLWHVHYLDSTNSALNTQKINYGGDWEYEGNNYPTNFKFPGFKWVGGFYYAVSHTVNYKGCNSKTVWDTIFVAPGANITFGRPITYGQNISGNQSVQLKGYVTNADSFNWEPTTWLDTSTSLTPISTPVDNITYILSAYKDGCVARDTAHIKYNRFANAGYNDTLCLDSNHNTETLLGFPYDMSLFLGMLYYYDNGQFMSYYNSHNITNAPNYFRYFTHFMHTQEFADAASLCPNNLYNLFTNTVQKDLFFKKQWYLEYYIQFTQNSQSNLSELANFNSQVTSTPELKNHLDSLTNWGNIDACFNEILNQYDTYVLNNQSTLTSVKWTKTPNINTALLTTWDNYFVAIDAPTESTKYTFSVITPDRAEIDEITILVDTTLKPLFAPAMQFDSTVFFMNYTEPISTATTYEWNFGDGSANSNEQNPIHTFPAFDTSYIVCLTARNKCNSWQYCDTVYINSLHLGGTLKTAYKPAFFETNISSDKSESLNDRLALSNKLEARSKELVALQNYPNPFNQSTIIDYQIWQSFSQAELRITNVLGQVLYTQKLQKPIDKVEIDGSNLANGLYYYSIVVDNSIKLTKTMSVIH